MQVCYHIQGCTKLMRACSVGENLMLILMQRIVRKVGWQRKHLRMNFVLYERDCARASTLVGWPDWVGLEFNRTKCFALPVAKP